MKNVCKKIFTFNCLERALFESALKQMQTFRMFFFSTTSDGEKRSIPFNPSILHICQSQGLQGLSPFLGLIEGFSPPHEQQCRYLAIEIETNQKNLPLKMSQHQNMAYISHCISVNQVVHTSYVLALHTLPIAYSIILWQLQTYTSYLFQMLKYKVIYSGKLQHPSEYKVISYSRLEKIRMYIQLRCKYWTT